VRRTVVRRNEHELQMQGITTQQIAIDMLNDPQVYPMPTKFKCTWCAFRQVCLQMNDGSDYQWTLNNQYKKVGTHYGHAV
jgi:hypothetical protein